MKLIRSFKTWRHTFKQNKKSWLKYILKGREKTNSNCKKKKISKRLKLLWSRQIPTFVLNITIELVLHLNHVYFAFKLLEQLWKSNLYLMLAPFWLEDDAEHISIYYTYMLWYYPDRSSNVVQGFHLQSVELWSKRWLGLLITQIELCKYFVKSFHLCIIFSSLKKATHWYCSPRTTIIVTSIALHFRCPKARKEIGAWETSSFFMWIWHWQSSVSAYK